jgi:hypothetical protein
MYWTGNLEVRKMRKCILPACVFLLSSGCFSSRAYFLPQGASVSPLDFRPAAVVALTEHSPPGGAAFLAVSSEGMVRSKLPDGKPAALLHVRFAFRNRSGLDVAFDPANVNVNLFVGRSAQPVPLAPTWIRPMGDVAENRVAKGKTGGFDLYFAVAPPGVVSSVGGFTAEWSYSLGEEEVASGTAFARTHRLLYHDYGTGGVSVGAGYYGTHYWAGPALYWWLPSLVVRGGSYGGRSYSGPSSWIRR